MKSAFSSSVVLGVGLDRFFRVWKVSGGIVRHVGHGDTLLNGYPARGTHGHGWPS